MSSKRAPVKRLLPHVREWLILNEAISLFARNGPDGLIPGLARKLGISQALIFRYFGTKEKLVDRVYEIVCFTRWDPVWEKMIGEESLDLADRLKAFFKSYIAIADDYNWVRISMFLALTDHEMKKRYVRSYVSTLIEKIARAVKSSQGHPKSAPLTDADKEQVWQIHSAIVHYGVRKHIHGSIVTIDRNQYVDLLVDRFMHGIGGRKEKGRRHPPRASVRARRAGPGTQP